MLLPFAAKRAGPWVLFRRSMPVGGKTLISAPVSTRKLRVDKRSRTKNRLVNPPVVAATNVDRLASFLHNYMEKHSVGLYRQICDDRSTDLPGQEPMFSAGNCFVLVVVGERGCGQSSVP